MNIFGIISLLGGLALFLYGMNILGDGLTKMSGGKLEGMLDKLSSNPIKGMLLGVAVTAVDQSSSATTVMIVGFVNSGIMKLTQASGIILGSNLGATFTPWILSLSSVSGESLILNFLSPDVLAPLLGIVGVILYVFTSNEKNHYIGSIMLGFLVLMTGMHTMSGAVSPLANNPNFTDLLLAFSNPVIGILVGLFVTAVIQSSSASIGILQALAISGTVTFGTAIPIIMGQNIGTCISALLSSIGARTNAKRAAFVHLYFNILKVIVISIGFYTINYFVRFSFLDSLITPVQIAFIHTFLNIIAVIIFMPFTKQLVFLAEHTIKDAPLSEDEIEYGKYQEELMALDDRFLMNPAVATEQCLNVSRRMAELTAKCIMSSMELMDNYSDKLFKRIQTLESACDIYEDRLGTYIVKLSQRILNINDSNKVSVILHSISNFERISDHAINISYVLQRIHEKEGRAFSKDCLDELDIYKQAVSEIVLNTTEVYETFDLDLAKRIEPLEEVIDNINERAKRHHIKRLKDGLCTVEMGVHFDNIINDFERISDHCSNIAVALIEINNNVYETHEYLDILKNTQSEEFQTMYKEYDNKFHL